MSKTMKKILIVEDRPERQEQYIPNGQNGVDRLSNMPGVTNLNGGDKSRKHLEELKTSTQHLGGYDLLIYHRSALNKLALINQVNEFCSKKGIPLIHFTGGENTTTYINDKFEYLLLDSRLFYSEKLFEFIELYQSEEEVPLIRFLYGDNWKLPYYLKLRDMLWQDEGEDINVVRFRENYNSILELVDSTESLTLAQIEQEIKKLRLLL